MKNRTLFFILSACIVFFTACHKKQLLEKPHNLIPYSQTVQLLSEIFMIESTINFAPADSNKAAVTVSLYNHLFQKYGITREQFEESISYYLADEDQSEKMLTEVSEIMEKKQKDFSRENEKSLSDDGENRSE